MGFSELVVVLVIVLILFGGAKLPALGEGLGKAIRNFKDAANGKDEQKPAAKDEPKPPASGAAG